MQDLTPSLQPLNHCRQLGFPGSQPVSMDTTNMHNLSRMPYRVSWKADGTRYLMLILGVGEVYMVDRDNAVFRVSNLRIPSRRDPHQEHVKDTLVDGVRGQRSKVNTMPMHLRCVRMLWLSCRSLWWRQLTGKAIPAPDFSCMTSCSLK